MTEHHGRPERPTADALRGVLADLRGALANARGAQERLFQVRGVAWSEDRLIKAVVGPRGQLIDLDIDPRVYRRPNSRALSAAIVATVRQAVEQATREAQQVLDESVPEDLRPARVGGVDVRRLVRTHDADLALDPEEEDGV
jgi:DNA-binding protein YbaB